MRVVAPGKVVLTGAYAVLAGAPAIVAAVDRYAHADTSRAAASDLPAEVLAAFEADVAPHTDVRALKDEKGRKLGLGSSAAAVVAALGACAARGGDDLLLPSVRERIFIAARDAHSRVQSGGSGVDVAASVHGGVLRYALSESTAQVRAVELPPGLTLAVFFSGESARTSDLRARVDGARAKWPREAEALSASMADAAHAAADAVDAADEKAFISLAQDYGDLLAALGSLADAPIVPASFATLARMARSEGAAFLPSGAGGGDVAVWLAMGVPSLEFARRAATLSVTSLPLSVDRLGVRTLAFSPF